MHFAIAVCFVTVVSVVGGAVNYCGARMCDYTDLHTYCQYPEGPSPACIGYISSPLSDDEKSRILARLNHRRNEAANGRFRGMPSAGNMLKLRWVEELAREAQRWADQCRPPSTPEENDACRDLYSVQVGQCVASVVGDAPGLRVDTMVDIWFMQSMWYKGNVSFYLPPMDTKHYYGDFAQLLWSRSYLVGCGRSKFMTEWKGRLQIVERLVCNVGPRGPHPTRPLWAVAPPVAACPPRAWPHDENYTALCDFQKNNNFLDADDESTAFIEDLFINVINELEENKTMNYIGSLDETYLTLLAVATLGDIGPTLDKNSMLPKDIIEMVQFGVKNNNNMNDLIENITKTDVKKILLRKKNVTLIGRPKAYAIGDLTNYIEDTSKNEKRLTIVPKDVYPEYELSEITDANITAMAWKKNITYIAKNVTSESEREIEEALEGLENAVEQEVSEKPGKVRRELREYATKIMPKLDPIMPFIEAVTKGDAIETSGTNGELNKSIYDLVMKIVPHLNVMSKGSELHCLSSTAVLVLLLLFVVI